MYIDTTDRKEIVDREIDRQRKQTEIQIAIRKAEREKADRGIDLKRCRMESGLTTYSGTHMRY